MLWINNTQTKRRNQLELSIVDIFKPEVQLVRDYISKHSGNEWQTQEETQAIEHIFLGLKQKATALDRTLAAAAGAALAKMKLQLTVLEKKMLRAEKKKMEIQLLKITRLKNALFPANGLQERVENFSEYYLQYGPAFFDTVKNGIDPLGSAFLIIE